MERHFDLIKNTANNVEKRLFPRFPFYYLLFKDNKKGEERIFEVQDISITGMQLGLKDGAHNHQQGDRLEGTLYWKGQSIEICGEVKWGVGLRLGILFDPKAQKLQQHLKEFFSPENVVKNLRLVSLESDTSQMEYPSNLKYWIHAGRAMEIFIWKHLDGELSRFQILFLKEFVEWEDGKGLFTGKILNSRCHDTPLTSEDEFVLSMDEGVDQEKMEWARHIIAHIPGEVLPTDAINFLKVKLT
ncbi:MAG: PilZ domain-containing protein [Pseudomonadota bacterium]